jgi:hypothetical protein
MQTRLCQRLYRLSHCPPLHRRYRSRIYSCMSYIPYRILQDERASNSPSLVLGYPIVCLCILWTFIICDFPTRWCSWTGRLEMVVPYVISFFYLPANLTTTDRLIFGKKSWFNERETQIAVTRIIRDDLTKNDQYKAVTWEDFKMAALDTKLWVHLIISFLTLMPITPIGTYLPTIIKQTGFSVYIANLLAAPTYIVGLFFSILIARGADKYGNTSLWAQVAIVWGLLGALLLEFLPDDTNKWVMYFAAFVIASTPSSHGMHIAWMSSNLAPIGKRTLALGWIIGAANICAVPGSQIYTASDSPRFHRGNWILVGITLANGFFFLFQRYRYMLTNKYRQKKWDNMTDEQKRVYNETTKHKGSNRLDYRFHL